MLNLKSAKKSKSILFGSWITISNTNILEIFTNYKFDWLCIDMEHSSIDLNDISNMTSIIESNNIIPLVRIGEKDPNLIKRIMDCGAHGVIVADVRTYEEAKNIVDSVKYPPIGKRGVGLFKAQHYGKKFDEYKKWLLEESFIIPQIEHFEAIKNLNEILSLKDIDGIMVGPYDLSGSLGKPGNFEDKDYQKYLDEIIKIVQDSKKIIGIHSVSTDPKDAVNFINRGFNFIGCSLDSIFLMDNIKKYMEKLKNYE